MTSPRPSFALTPEQALRLRARGDMRVTTPPSPPCATEATSPDPEITRVARILGSLGGKKGGLARAAVLTPARRSEIARKAAKVRWRRVRGEVVPP